MSSTSDAAAMREEAARVARTIDITLAGAGALTPGEIVDMCRDQIERAIRALPLPPAAPSPDYAAGVEAALAIVRETKDSFDPAKNQLAIPGSDQERALFTSIWSTAFGLECDIKKLLPGPAIRRLAPPPVAPGWQVVPKEPTEEMIDAAADIVVGINGDRDPHSGPHSPQIDIYRAMLAAAPASPSPADTGGKEERAAIVAWLRRRDVPAFEASLDLEIADAIERGDHLAPAGKSESANG